MEVKIEHLPKSLAKLTIELPPEAMKPYLERAARDLSSRHKIEGFRPGMASLGIVIGKLGAGPVWEHAADEAVRKSFVQAIIDHDLPTVGQPEISVSKLAPDNPLIFTATVAVLPTVKLGEYHAIKSRRTAPQVEPAAIDKALDDLRNMMATETPVDRPAKSGDKVEVDFDLFIDHVAVENGSSRQHPVTIGSNQFIPGFEENLIGLKKDETKEFSVTFPAAYHAAHLANKKGDFKVTAKNIFQIDQPPLDDEFAKKAGKFNNLAELRTQLEKNLTDEAEANADAKFERAIIEEIIDRSTFDDIPEILMTNELDKMIEELKDDVARRGAIKFEDYLQGLKKTVADLRTEFQAPAARRIKAALVLRTIAKAENVTANDTDVDEEINNQLRTHSYDPNLQERIKSGDFRDFIRHQQVNRAVVEKLKSWATEKKPE